MKKLLVVIVLAGSLGACQSTNPQDYTPDPDCLPKKVGSKVLSRAAGIGLGLAGVPGAGLVGRGISMVTNPRCDAFKLKDEARERLAREQAAGTAPNAPKRTEVVIRPTVQPRTQSLVPDTVYTR